MDPFKCLTAKVAPLDRASIDTDQLVPKQFLKLVQRTGFGQFLFFNWRFDAEGNEITDFVLNRPEYSGSGILVAGPNFGSGSSREHAPWALMDYGFRVVIAPSFADIFRGNCLQNGLVPVVLGQEHVDRIIARATAEPGYSITVDLEACEVRDASGWSVAFEMPAYDRYRLLNGLDDIGLTLQHSAAIEAFEKARPSHMPSLK